MLNKRIILILTVFVGISTVSTAQSFYNLWLETANDASISMPGMVGDRLAEINYSYSDGDFKGVMEAKSNHIFGFRSLGFVPLKKINLWGKFEYSHDKMSGKAYSDLYLPYSKLYTPNSYLSNSFSKYYPKFDDLGRLYAGNPYQVGSPTKSNYTAQNFDFQVKAASVRLFDFLTAGLGFNYKINDISRLQDPRSRVITADMSVNPSFIFQLARKHQLGVNFSYEYAKEKINGYVSKANQASEYYLIVQEGLGVFKKSVSSGFNRRYFNNILGGAIQYAYGMSELNNCSAPSSKSNISILVEEDFRALKTNIEDDFRSVPGDYSKFYSKTSFKTQIKHGAAIEKIGLKYYYINSTAQKCFQKIVSTTDPITGVTSSKFETLFSTKSYLENDMIASLSYYHYKLKNTANNGLNQYKWYIGANLSFDNSSSKYIYHEPNSSISYNNLLLNLDFGIKAVERNRHELSLNAALGYMQNLNGDYYISTGLEDKTISEAVCIPDFEYFTTDCLSVAIGAKYIFPIKKQLFYINWNASFYQSIDANGINRFANQIGIGIIL